MRKTLLCGAALAAIGACGCGSTTTTFVKSDTTLGRVVVYRNGVAYFERYADVTGDSLKLAVPADKVDDFLKSLTVVDAKTGEPATLSYPSQSDDSGFIAMKVGTTGVRRLKLSYVTEAPSWKPSYRVVVDKGGKVALQGWAIVDNTSGEDWQSVKLGVGSSSAMSFRFDLKNLRIVTRETLRENDLFAQAPPMGSAAYGGGTANARVVADLSEELVNRVAMAGAPAPPATTAPMDGPSRPMSKSGGAARHSTPMPQDPIGNMSKQLASGNGQIVVEGYANADDKDKMTASLDRANRVRDDLVRNGVDPNKVVAVARGEMAGRAGGARIVEAPMTEATAKKNDAAKEPIDSAQSGKASPSTDPIGTSHFESPTAMTVPRGTSAMVSILHDDTEGEVVYLYDPETPRGNAQFPFKTLRFKNPTDSALESGPVSVFGDGRFIGEGLADPIPPKAIAFVPFALDRQIVVERKDAERDDISKIVTVSRGVFSTEIRHTKRATFTLYNRMPERASVFLRHSVPEGYKLTKTPDGVIKGADDDSAHLAGAHLFRVELEPNAHTDIVVEEATPVFRSTDIRTSAGRDLVRAYVTGAALEPGLKSKVEHLLELNAEMSKIDEHITTLHEQMGEYRQRMDELHSQIFTLKAVKTAGPLMAHLEKTLTEFSEKLSKATIDVVTLQEKQMVARVEFQNGAGDLTLDPSDKERDSRSAAK